MPELATPRGYAGRRLAVTAICCACHHAITLDLAELAAGPHADTPLPALPPRCQCGARDHSTRISYLDLGMRNPRTVPTAGSTVQ